MKWARRARGSPVAICSIQIVFSHGSNRYMLRFLLLFALFINFLAPPPPPLPPFEAPPLTFVLVLPALRGSTTHAQHAGTRCPRTKVRVCLAQRLARPPDPLSPKPAHCAFLLLLGNEHNWSQ